MPGVLIVEALAQTGAVAILSQPEWKGKTAYFAGINKAKFKQKVVPGDTLVLETEIIKVKGTDRCGAGNSKSKWKTGMFRRIDICNRIGERQCFLIKNISK